MNRFRARTNLAALAAMACLLTTSTTMAAGKYSEIARGSKAAVVKIETADGKGEAIGHGSGFIVASNGVVVTNYHVIKGAHSVVVKLSNGERYAAENVIEFDAERDFALLKIPVVELQALPLANSNLVEIGDEVAAMGHPVDQDYTFSTGIISQKRDAGGYTLLQTTVPVAPGSSGGPLMNLDGRVVGVITSQLVKGQNINFALPINYVRGAMETGLNSRYTVTQVEKWQKDEELKVLAKLFGSYDDQYKSYSVVVPKAFKMDRAERWNQSKTILSVYTVFVPENSERGETMGYLSEGIRVKVEIPAKGKEFRETQDEVATRVAQQTLTSNPGFVQTRAGESKLGGIAARQVTILGESDKISEPEKATFVVIARPQCQIVVEMVAPVRKFEDYSPIFKLFTETFEFKGCPAWKD